MDSDIRCWATLSLMNTWFSVLGDEMFVCKNPHNTSAFFLPEKKSMITASATALQMKQYFNIL